MPYHSLLSLSSAARAKLSVASSPHLDQPNETSGDPTDGSSSSSTSTPSTTLTSTTSISSGLPHLVAKLALYRKGLVVEQIARDVAERQCVELAERLEKAEVRLYIHIYI